MDLYNEIYHHDNYDPEMSFFENVTKKFKHRIKEISNSNLVYLPLAEVAALKNCESEYELLLKCEEYPLARFYLVRLIMKKKDILTDEDYCRAINELIICAKDGCYEACIKIAQIYELSDVKKNLKKSFKWYCKAKDIKSNYFNNKNLEKLKEKITEKK